MNPCRALPPGAARRTLTALCCAPVLLLAACGGGGSGGASTTPSGALAITSVNARALAADALDSATNLALPRASSVLLFATGILTTNERLCRGGGSLTLTRNPQNFLPITTGDTVQLTSSACKELVDGVETTMSGSLSVTFVQAVTPGVFPADLVLAIQTSDFSMVAGGKSTTASGDLTYASADSMHVDLSGTSLTYGIVTAAGEKTYTLRNYRQSTSSGGSVSIVVEAGVTTNNPRLGATASYRVSNPTAPIVMNVRDFTGGSLRVDAAGSSLGVTVTGTNTFRLDVDTNGDGTVDATSTATLDELRAAI
jgi:hypothetical protein